MGANILIGDECRNSKGQDLGEIGEIMLDMNTERIGYAVVLGGFWFKMGDKLFAMS